MGKNKNRRLTYKLSSLAKDTDLFENSKDKKVMLLTTQRTIITKMYIYLEKHNLITPKVRIKKQELFNIFVDAVGWEIPPKENIIEYLIKMYLSGEHGMFRAQLGRSDIPPRVWKRLKKQVYEKYGKVCLCCGSTEDITVDHIKPYSIYPELCVDFDNLQPLCGKCNAKKGNKDMTDYRKI